MDNKVKSQHDDCTIFQEKIFGVLEEGNPVDSDSSLNNHIKICPICNDYLEKLIMLKNTMQVPPTNDLKPIPQILKNIIAYKNIKSIVHKKNQNSIWSLIRTIFEFRIPVYQALSGGVVAIVLFMYVSSNLISSETSTKYTESTGNQRSITSSELYILDTLNFTKSERGQNAKEDSVLISFLVSTM